MEKELEKFELCISCGRDTKIPVDKHVETRVGYIEGSGQLCTECFKEIFNKVHKKDDITE